jgi:hypothetical protein
VGHLVYRIEGQYLKNPLFLRPNGVSPSIAQLSAKIVRCGKIFKKYPEILKVFGGAAQVEE